MNLSEAENHFQVPSPLHRVVTKWTEQHKIDFFIKRDDLIHPFVSGNKWRKLSGILKAHENDDITEIATYGGAYSNHLLATACVASILKLKCVGRIRGEKPEVLNPVLKMCESFGMRLEFLDRTSYSQLKYSNGVKDTLLTIPEGGACEEGTTGCADIISELPSDMDQLFVACGTGTTIAGLHKGGSKILLNGIQVLKGENYILNELSDKFKVADSRIKMHDRFHEGGYAKTTDFLLSFMREFTAETGILLDPIYTGKMMFALYRLCKENKVMPNSKVVALHTGGLTGWFGKYKDL